MITEDIFLESTGGGEDERERERERERGRERRNNISTAHTHTHQQIDGKYQSTAVSTHVITTAPCSKHCVPLSECCLLRELNLNSASKPSVTSDN